MKIRSTLLLLCAFMLSKAQSPITLTTADMPTVGLNQTIAIDTPLTTVNYGSAGANQVYDFSTLTATKNQTAHYVALSGSQQPKFPNANLALTTDYSSYVMLKNSSAKFDVEGLEGYAFGSLTDARFSPVEDLYHFPATYQGTYSGSWGFQQTFTGSQVGQGSVDSVRVTFTDTYTDVIDGWGETKTPVGSYKSLRVKRTNQTTTVYEYYLCIFFSCNWQTYSTDNENTTLYSYVAKETKGSVVSFDYDSAGNVKSAKYALTPPAAPVAHFTDANGVGGLINFTDNTDGYPTKYHYSFGDGDTSNVKNPNHVYAANGAYYVCETVYNAGGNNTYCDTVHVTGITAANHAPQAANDATTVLQPAGASYNVTANDIDPDNNPLCISTVYGDAHFVKTGCSNITYTPDSAFSGTATCFYIVCDNATPALCDTATFTVTSTFNPALLPVAHNDSVHLLQNEAANINVGANDTDPNGGFCVTSLYGGSPQPSFFAVDGGNCKHIVYTPNSTFTGSDSIYYVICDNGHTVWCDTALLVVKATSIASLTPVAVNDIVSVLQPATTVINAGGNDQQPNGPACITALFGGTPQPSYFSINGSNCTHVDFHADSTYKGDDSIYYVICDNVHTTWCDTGLIIVRVIENPALLPVASFRDSAVGCINAFFVNTSHNYSSPVQWHLSDLSPGTTPDTTVYGEIVEFQGSNHQNYRIQACLTVSNQFGQTTICDTVNTVCEGINETQLSNIAIYPNPASNILTIDMRNNSDDITKNYSAIEVYNVIGETVRTTPRNNQNKLVNITVSDLPQGVYMAAIVDTKGTKNTLGRFVKQ